MPPVSPIVVNTSSSQYAGLSIFYPTNESSLSNYVGSSTVLYNDMTWTSSVPTGGYWTGLGKYIELDGLSRSDNGPFIVQLRARVLGDTGFPWQWVFSTSGTEGGYYECYIGAHSGKYIVLMRSTTGGGKDYYISSTDSAYQYDIGDEILIRCEWRDDTTRRLYLNGVMVADQSTEDRYGDTSGTVDWDVDKIGIGIGYQVGFVVSGSSVGHLMIFNQIQSDTIIQSFVSNPWDLWVGSSSLMRFQSGSVQFSSNRIAFA